MSESRTHRSVTSLPTDEQLVSVHSAIEQKDGSVLIGCQLSDENLQVGQFAVLRLFMDDSAPVELLYSFDDFAVAHHARDQEQQLLVELGDFVHSADGGAWTRTKVEAADLQTCFILDQENEFVAGKSGEVFRRHQGIWTKENTASAGTILQIKGTNLNNLVAVGSEGTMIRRTETEWVAIELGMDVDIRDVHLNNETAFIAADQGVLGVLLDSEFTRVETGMDSDFLSIVSHKGRVFCCDSEFGLSCIDGTDFEQIANLGYVYRLSSGPNWITASAGQHVFQFDGTFMWRGIRVFYDDGYQIDALDMSVLD